MSDIEFKPQYELTPKGEREQRSHVTAKAHLEAGAATWLCYCVIYKGADVSKSPARRRVLAWALRHGYLRPTRPSRARDTLASIDEDLERARQALEKKDGV